MRTLFAAVLLSLLVGLPAAAEAQTRASAPHKQESGGHSSSLNKDLALVGGGVLGLVMASGVVGLVNAGTLIYGGAAITDALETGAGLAMPIALLGVALGAVLGQETVLRNINWLMGGGEAKGGH